MIMVDEDNNDGKFGYKNKEGDIEYVAIHTNNDSILFYDNWNEDMSCIFIDDIPKMIKALQAAYDYSKK